MTRDLPTHVWYVHDQSMLSPRPPMIGLLLEWRRTEDRHSVAKWEGLVAFARTGGALELAWIRAAMLKPAEAQEAPAEHGVSTGTT